MSDSEAWHRLEQTIEVWDFTLELADDDRERIGAWLSVEERRRAQAFRFPRDREHFIAAHGRLRELLAEYAGGPPTDLRFENGENGKPHLAPGALGADLSFNLSHSHGRALVAVTRGVEIGVDLEQIRSDVDSVGIVASHFSPMERAAWAALSPPRRHDAFFHGWARKEAYVKARGDGLSREPAAYTVELDPGVACHLLVADSLDPEAPTKWEISCIKLSGDFAAAVAYQAPVRSVVIRSK